MGPAEGAEVQLWTILERAPNWLQFWAVWLWPLSPRLLPYKMGQ